MSVHPAPEQLFLLREGQPLRPMMQRNRLAPDPLHHLHKPRKSRTYTGRGQRGSKGVYS